MDRLPTHPAGARGGRAVGPLFLSPGQGDFEIRRCVGRDQQAGEVTGLGRDVDAELDGDLGRVDGPHRVEHPLRDTLKRVHDVAEMAGRVGDVPGFAPAHVVPYLDEGVVRQQDLRRVQTQFVHGIPLHLSCPAVRFFDFFDA